MRISDFKKLCQQLQRANGCEQIPMRVSANLHLEYPEHYNPVAVYDMGNKSFVFAQEYIKEFSEQTCLGLILHEIAHWLHETEVTPKKGEYNISNKFYSEFLMEPHGKIYQGIFLSLVKKYPLHPLLINIFKKNGNQNSMGIIRSWEKGCIKLYPELVK